MTRKGKATKRQRRKLLKKWYDGALRKPRYAELSRREFSFIFATWPMSLEGSLR